MAYKLGVVQARPGIGLPPFLFYSSPPLFFFHVNGHLCDLKHNLPPPINADAVATLDVQPTREYYRGYYGPGGLPPVAQRKPAILIAIGSK